MNYIDEIFERADMNLITEFLLDGAVGDRDSRPYIERIEESEHRCIEYIEKHTSDLKEKDGFTDAVLKHIGTVESVYMEIGLLIGAKLAWKIFRDLKL